MRRLTLIATVAVLTSGCSTVKLLYGQADILIESWVDKHIELDGEQEELADRRVDDFLAWHRAVMLPRYADFMRRVARAHEKGNFDRPGFDAVALEVRHLWEDTVRGVFPFMAEIFTTLTPDQIERFHRKLEERTEEAEKKWSRPSPEQIEDSIDNTILALEMFVGDLTEAQVRSVQAGAQPLYDREPRWVDNRHRRNAAVVGFLRNRPSREEIEAFLEPWLLRPYEFSPVGYKDYAEGFRRDIEGIIYGVLSTLDGEQRREFREALKDFADDLVELAS